MAKRGDVEPELDRLGLRSSSESDSWMGAAAGVRCWNEPPRGVEGCPGGLDGGAAAGSEEDHGGTGGRL